MKPFPFSIVVLTFLTLVAAPLRAYTVPVLPESLDLPAINRFLASNLEIKEQVGLSIAIVRNGELEFAKSYGKKSLEHGEAVQTNTLFAIGSVTKQFTCACLLLLAQEGILSVHDKVAKYFPDLTRAADITLLDLMNHTSGYPDYYPLDFVVRSMQEPISADELLRQYAGGKLDFEPGTRYSYSNTGYILLGRIIEKASGEEFGTFLTRRILKPLELHNTVYEPDPTDPRLARGYLTFALSKPEYTRPEGKGWIGAAGGLYSTPTDLAKWNMALIQGKVLKPEFYQLMTSPRKLSTGKISYYGCGLAVAPREGRQVLTHSGGVSGFVSWNGVIPSTQSALIMTCNRDGGLGTLPNQLFSLLLKEPSNVPKINAPISSETVKKIFADFQAARIDRKAFSEEFNHYLTDEKVAGAASRLKSFGKIQRTETISSNERGGMEVTMTRLIFKNGNLKAQMYRQPDGTIEQFFVYPD